MPGSKRKRRRRARRPWLRRLGWALAAVPLAYLAAALVGSLVPVNRHWVEPDSGVTVYLADNGVHSDLVMPVRAAGLDWRTVLDPGDVADPAVDPRWVAVGTGERAVYLDTPTWSDLRLRTALHALTRGEQIVHVEWVDDPTYSAREIRLRPHEYRRLWAAVRASLRDGRAQRIDHPGYHSRDAFYEGAGATSALRTCNQWTASRLRLAGVKTSLWPPFAQGLAWRYRLAEPPPS